MAWGCTSREKGNSCHSYDESRRGHTVEEHVGIIYMCRYVVRFLSAILLEVLREQGDEAKRNCQGS